MDKCTQHDTELPGGTRCAQCLFDIPGVVYVRHEDPTEEHYSSNIAELVDHAKWAKANGKKATVDPTLLLIMINRYYHGRDQGVHEALSVLRGEAGERYAWEMYEKTRCSKNDAHITRREWADFIEKELL